MTLKTRTLHREEAGVVPRGNDGDGSWRDGFRGRGSGGWGSSLPAGKIALWLFLATATVVFLLLLSAYRVRMGGPDWRSLPLPGILWLNTGLLIMSSGVWEWARRASRRSDSLMMRFLLVTAGGTAVLFLLGQIMAWQKMSLAGYFLATNPASSFFYLLTALHGLHVLGGLVAWGWTTVLIWRKSARSIHLRIELCAIYWHFLMLIWLVVFGVLWFEIS